MRRRWIAVPLVLLLGFAILAASQRRIDAVRDQAFDEQLLYLPKEELLTHFTAGLNGVVGDVLWLKCIQYTMTHFKGDQKFTWLYQMCDMITTLDPHFVDAYRFGGVFLAALKADDDAGLTLLEKGVLHNPDRWELPYEMGVVYLLNRREQPGSAETAAAYLKVAAESGTAPAPVIEFAANLQYKHNLVDMERDMWQEMLESKDSFMRDMARRKLTELDLRTACADLDKAVAMYAQAAGRPPAQLDELVTGGLLRALPVDPLGGTFIIDAKGKVQSTTLLDGLVQRRLNMLRADLKQFHAQEGRWPSALDELTEKKVSSQLPPHPYSEPTWKYDPQTGDVE